MSCGCKERREWIAQRVSEGVTWFDRWLDARRRMDPKELAQLEAERELEQQTQQGGH